MERKLKEFEHLINPDKKNLNILASQSEKPEKAADSNLSLTASKPVPDYRALREQSIEQQLIVREFFMPRGTDALFGSSREKKKKNENETSVTIIDENNIDDTGEYEQKLVFKIKETNEEIARVLPAVDSKSQMNIRRTIFFDKLVKW